MQPNAIQSSDIQSIANAVAGVDTIASADAKVDANANANANADADAVNVALKCA